jgi:hypothetical protein
MSARTIILCIAVIAIGMLMLPQTLSMFSGQHTWYDPEGRGIPCDKCHFLEMAELASGPHSLIYAQLYNSSASYGGTSGKVGGATFWGGDRVNDRCYGCHQVGNNASGEGEWDNRDDVVHAAVTIACTDCHPWVAGALDRTISSHREFYNNLNLTEEGTLVGGNEACIGCHTSSGVNISWTRYEKIEFAAGKPGGEWQVGEMSATGDNVTFISTGG